MKQAPPTLYRPASAVMLLNREGLVFVARRIDSIADAWQMPQGGLDPGEDPEACAWRELEEETGIAPHCVELIAAAPEVLRYDLPAELQGRMWKGRYRGQAQHWFLARFLGQDADVNLETRHPEFNAWKWVEPQSLPELIVPFKKALYEQVLAVFAPYLVR